MFGWFSGKNKREERARDLSRDLKVIDSQRRLLDAATQTADAANVVTHRLRSRLEDSIAQIESTARIMNDALIICDLDGAIQAFNPAAEQLFAMTSDEARETFIGELIHSSDDLSTGAEVWDLLDATAGSDQMMGTRRNGTSFSVDINHTQLDRSDGTSIVLLVLREVITDQESKGYRSMFESNFDGILVVKGKKIVAANPAVSHLFGYTTDELLSKSLDMLIFSMSNDIPTNDTTVDAIHQNGQQIEVYFTTTTIWWSGEPASLITIRDMTHMRSAREKEADQPNMICCFDEDYKITFANTLFASHYGMSSSVVRGQDIRALMGDEERNLFQIHINGLSSKEPTRRMQMRSGSSLQTWTDHVSLDGGEIEYQRIGRDLSSSIRSKEKT